MDVCVMERDLGSEMLHKRQKDSKNSAAWASPGCDQLGQQPESAAAKSLNQALSDDVQRRPRYATKAATAAKRLQAVAAARDASRRRCFPSATGSDRGGCDSGAIAAATTIAGVTAIDPPVQRMSATATRAHVANSAAEPLAPSGQSAGPGAAADIPDAARCTAGRGRLPGLRTRNRLGPTGATTAHGQGAALPLLLASSRGGSDAQGAGTGAAPGPGLGQAAHSVPAPLPRGISADEPSARRSPTPPHAHSPGAFLPPPAVQPDSTWQPQSAENNPAAASAVTEAAGAVSSGYSDGACVGEAAAARAAMAPTGGRCKDADGGGAGRGQLATGRDAPAEGGDAVVVVQCQPQRQGADYGGVDAADGGMRGCDNGKEGNGANGDADRGLDDDDDDDGASSYCSSNSGGTLSGSDGKVLSVANGAADGIANTDADDASGGARKRRRVGGATPAPAADAAAMAAGAAGQGGGTEEPAVANGEGAAVEPAGAAAEPAGAGADDTGAATAAGDRGTTAASGRRRRRRSCYSYGPPWPLVPRSGRPGTLRFNIRAARALWPELLAAWADVEEGQMVKLYVEVPAAEGRPAAAVAGSAADVEVATVVRPVRAELRFYDEAGMILRAVDRWPMGGGISPDKLLQISPHPAGDGALVQVANRHVWACYTVRGGKLCSPEVPPLQPGGGGSGGGDGGGSGDAGGGGPRPDCREGGGLLQMRLGAGLFNNRRFDVGVRAAERLFGHLLERPRQQVWGVACGGGGGPAEGDGAAAAGGAAEEGPRAGPAAVPAAGTAVSSLPIHSVNITVVAEAYPETRFQVEFRYRFPRMYGFASNARHSYATLSSSLMAPLVLCGAKQGDVLEMWRRPGGAPDEFLCRVVRSEAADRGGVKRVVAAKRRASTAAGGGVCADRGAAAETLAAAAPLAAAGAATAASPGAGGAVVERPPPAAAAAADRG